MPVLPDDGSRIVAPGLSTPSRSASSIILSAMRSFDEPPGFWPSSLAQMLTSGFGRQLMHADERRVADQPEDVVVLRHALTRRRRPRGGSTARRRRRPWCRGRRGSGCRRRPCRRSRTCAARRRRRAGCRGGPGSARRACVNTSPTVAPSIGDGRLTVGLGAEHGGKLDLDGHAAQVTTRVCGEAGPAGRLRHKQSAVEDDADLRDLAVADAIGPQHGRRSRRRHDHVQPRRDRRPGAHRSATGTHRCACASARRRRSRRRAPRRRGTPRACRGGRPCT